MKQSLTAYAAAAAAHWRRPSPPRLAHARGHRAKLPPPPPILGPGPARPAAGWSAPPPGCTCSRPGGSSGGNACPRGPAVQPRPPARGPRARKARLRGIPFPIDPSLTHGVPGPGVGRWLARFTTRQNLAPEREGVPSARRPAPGALLPGGAPQPVAGLAGADLRTDAAAQVLLRIWNTGRSVAAEGIWGETHGQLSTKKHSQNVRQSGGMAPKKEHPPKPPPPLLRCTQVFSSGVPPACRWVASRSCASWSSSSSNAARPGPRRVVD